MTMHLAGTILFSIVVFIAVIGVIVLFHEMGHYIVGRLFGFAIEAFSIGFGPKIAERKGRYNLWQLRWILAGGYVKFAGELDNPEELPAGVAREALFANRKRWQRFLVLVAGVASNVFLAYALFAGLAFYGVDESITRDRPPVIGWLADGSPAQKAGLRPGDTILSVDSRGVSNWEEAHQEIYTLMSKPYVIHFLREGKEMDATVDPVTVEFLHQPMGAIGVAAAVPATIGAVASPSAAMDAGLKPLDEILEVGGAKVQYWDQVQQALLDNKGTPVALKIKRGAEVIELQATPRYVPEDKRYLLGVRPQEQVFVRYSFPECFLKAGRLIADNSTLAFRTFAKLAERKMPLSALSGPPTLAYISGEVARTGLYNLLYLVAVISVQIGIFNLLPVPGLDGGLVFVLAIEAIIRRDLPLIVKEWIMRVGFAALILLFAAIIVLDVMKFL